MYLYQLKCKKKNQMEGKAPPYMKLYAELSMYFHVTDNKSLKIFGKKFYLCHMTRNRISNLQLNLWNY